MKFKLAAFKNCLGEFARTNGSPSVRELTYQHILFHKLSEIYPDQILTEMLISKNRIITEVGASTKPLVKKYFKTNREFCPDLIILDKKLSSCGKSFSRISRFDKDLPLAAFVELKATSTSHKRSRREYQKDAAKLQLISDYWASYSGGCRPLAIQVVLNWPSGSDKFVEKEVVRSWFKGSIAKMVPDVHVIRRILVTGK